MDRSLGEIIAERPRDQAGSRRQPRRPRRAGPRDGRKTSRVDEADLDRDWVHDRYEDDRETHSYRRGGRPTYERRSRDPEPRQESGAKLRVDNLHYDLTERDLEGLFNRMGPVLNVSLRYDRAGRSDGVAFVTYRHLDDAKAAIREFDGANAKGQPIRLTLISSGRRLSDYVEPPHRSLFDRVEKPRGAGNGGGGRRRGGRDSRSLSPMSEDEEMRDVGARGGRRRGGDKGGLDRYVPPGARERDWDRERERERGRGRSPGAGGSSRSSRRPRARRGGREPAAGGAGGAAPRPKKTQEQLDQEMEDYWNATGSGSGVQPQEQPAAAEGVTGATPAIGAPPVAAEAMPAQGLAPQQPANVGGMDDDIDMIE